jgi:hypothetical protein
MTTSASTTLTLTPNTAPASEVQGRPVTPAALAALAAQSKTKAAKARAIGLDEQSARMLADAAALGHRLRDPAVSKAERQAAKKAAMRAMMALGLAPKSEGHGPMVRATLNRLMAAELGEKVVKRDQIAVELVLRVLTGKAVKRDGLKALDVYAKALKPDVSADTIKARKANFALAKLWFEGGGPKVYADALRVIKGLGGQVLWSKGTISLDRAMGLALGRNITAAEVAKDEQLSI